MVSNVAAEVGAVGRVQMSRGVDEVSAVRSEALVGLNPTSLIVTERPSSP